MKKSFFTFGLSVATAVAVSAAPAFAEWPQTPVRLVIPFAPGGGMDQTVLPLKPLLDEALGQPVLFDYRAGAGGRIGFEQVYMNGADGYVIGALSEPHFSNSTVFDTPRYTIDDIVPVGMFSSDVPIWFVHKDSPYETLADLIEAARENPGEITVATGSFTGEQYLSLAILEEQAGVTFRAVNVGGGGPVMTNVLGGHMDAGVIRPASVLGIKDEIRGLAVLAAARNANFPDVPTFDEQVGDDIQIPHLSSSRGFMVHRDFAENNPEGFARLEKAVYEAVHSEAYAEALERMGLELNWVSSEDASAAIRATVASMQQYREMVEAAAER